MALIAGLFVDRHMFSDVQQAINQSLRHINGTKPETNCQVCTCSSTTERPSTLSFSYLPLAIIPVFDYNLVPRTITNLNIARSSLSK